MICRIQLRRTRAITNRKRMTQKTGLTQVLVTLPKERSTRQSRRAPTKAGQIQQMKQMGGLSSLMDKLPSQLTAKAGSLDMDKAEKDIKRKEGIIQSMTPLERRKPELIKATRKKRIANGAGVHVQEVNRLLKEFEQMQDMMKKMKGGGLMKMMKRMGGMKGLGGMPKMPFGGS